MKQSVAILTATNSIANSQYCQKRNSATNSCRSIFNREHTLTSMRLTTYLSSAAYHLSNCIRNATRRLVLASALTLPLLAHSAETPVDSILAIVNDDIILTSEFVRERDTMLIQNQPGLPKAEELDKLIVERLIIRSIQLQEAERRNIRIDDSNLQRAIEDMARNNNMSLTQLRQSVTGEGLDFLQFREDLRKDLLVSTLTRREIESNLFVSDSEVEELLSTGSSVNGEYRYNLEHILVKLPQQADAQQDAAALKTAQALASRARDDESFVALVRSERSKGTDIEGGNLGTRPLSDMPALFAQQMNGLQQGDVTEPLRSVAGYHILKLVSRTTISQATPSNVRARHVLVSTRAGRSNTEAQQRIREVQQQLNGGADFAAVASAFSDDSASAKNGGNLGWFAPGEMVAEFEQVAFSTPVNVVSQPFKTAFGWHIVEVLEQKLDQNPQGELKTKAREQLRQQKAEDKYENWLSTLRDNAYVELRGFAKKYQ